MRRFHIIGVTEDLTHTLVIRTAAGWLLPWLDDNPWEELPLQVEAVLRRITSSSVFVHAAALPPCPPESIEHGYCCAVVSKPLNGTGVVAVANTELVLTGAVIPLQRDAWQVALARLRAPVADFDSGADVTAALEWAERQIADRTGARVLSTTRHRCSRYEYVIRADTTHGTMYFKGGRERVADEAVLTDLLSAVDSRAAPRTVAIDVGQGRWVYRELRGDLLLGPRLTVHTAGAAAAALAALQKRTLNVSAVRAHLSARRLTATGLLDTIDRIVQKVTTRHDSVGAWRASLEVMAERCAAVDRLRLPPTLILSDFRPRNVVATTHGVGFIDVERSYWSLPLLPLWRFTHEVERMLDTNGAARERIESAFAAEWADIIPPADMTRALSELPLLGGLFSVLLASRELDLQERDIGSPLPAEHRATVLSRYIRRTLSAAMPRLAEPAAHA